MIPENTVAAEQDAIQGAACSHHVSELSASVKQRLESAGSEARHSAERARVMAERALGKVQRQIEDRPLVVLTATVVGCLAVGLTAGWLIGFRRSR